MVEHDDLGDELDLRKLRLVGELMKDMLEWVMGFPLVRCSTLIRSLRLLTYSAKPVVSCRQDLVKILGKHRT